MPTHELVRQEADRLAVTVPEAARLLSISRAQMYNLLADGAVRSFKLGASRRIALTELEQLVARGVDHVRGSIDATR